jgi:hypothetical protein
MDDPLYGSGYSHRQRIGIVLRLFVKGILPGGPKRILQFLRTLPLFSPSRFPLFISDWIIGLSMRDYARRHLTSDAVEPGLADRHIAAFCADVRHYAEQDSITVSLEDGSVADLAIAFGKLRNRRILQRIDRHLQGLLTNTQVKLVLRVQNFEMPHRKQFKRLLNGLRRHSHRVSIVLDHPRLSLAGVDTSVFHLTLPARSADPAAAAPQAERLN